MTAGQKLLESEQMDCRGGGVVQTTSRVLIGCGGVDGFDGLDCGFDGSDGVDGAGFDGIDGFHGLDGFDGTRAQCWNPAVELAISCHTGE